ncbi:hypothetical protein JCM8547_003495 [Rhodosporidiobolus lusitaniae]
MKDSTALAASLGSVFGALFLSLSLAFARFAWRKRKSAKGQVQGQGRVQAVDPAYEAALDAEGGEGREGKKWFRWTRYGLTPVAEAGPAGTKQYMSGWFGLDPPQSAGWSSTSSPSGSFPSSSHPSSSTSTVSSASTWRESHFSRASRASRRAALKDAAARLTTRNKGDRDREGKKEKKRPRVSRTTELGMLEKDDEGEDEGEDKVEEGREREEKEEKGALRRMEREEREAWADAVAGRR